MMKPSSSVQVEVATVENIETPKHWSRYFLMLSIVLMIACLPLFFAMIGVGLAMNGVRHDMRELSQVLRSGRYVESQQLLKHARVEVRAAKARLTWVGPWRVVPILRSHLFAANEGLNAVDQGIGALMEVIDAVDKVSTTWHELTKPASALTSERRFSDLSRADRRQLLIRLEQVVPQLRHAYEASLLAFDAWDRVPVNELILPLRQTIAPFSQRLQTLRSEVDFLQDVLSIGLPLAGYPKPNTYLLLLQNADEMRPTGGFIGTVAVMRIDGGELTDVRIDDVYNFDRTASTTQLGLPPEPMRRELSVKAWHMRDRNWSPDVPLVAADISRLFVEQGWLAQSVTSVHVETIDGVILIEPAFFERLLHRVGSITVDGLTFTADGFFDQLQYAVEIGFAKKGIPIERRKDILAGLGKALIERLAAQPLSTVANVVDDLLTALNQKDVMLVVRDPKIQRLFDVRGWSGRARATLGDELWVVDANLAALKTDGVMNKQIMYSLDLTDAQSPIATVKLHYTNTNKTISWRHTRYRDYVRIYVPEGSELLSAEGVFRSGTGQSITSMSNVDVMHELGKTVFGAFWMIDPGETRDLILRYRLPERVRRMMVEQGKYQLLLQKQPGARQQLTLDVRIGKTIISATPAERADHFGDDRYQQTLFLDRDRSIEVWTNSVKN